MGLKRVKKMVRIRTLEVLYLLKIKKRKGILVYLGVHRGVSFSSIFQRYEVCYGFEANPKFFANLQKDYKQYPNVHIYNVAVAKEKGEIEFNISNNNGDSSSIGNFDENWFNKHIKMVDKIKIPAINLLEFLEDEGIEYVDEYISDIQGMDLEVLKTLSPMISQRKIGRITSEVAKNQYGNVYKDLPDNSEAGFNNYLGKNYECVAKGWGVLKDGSFNEVPEQWWEMDCRWKLRKQTIIS